MFPKFSMFYKKGWLLKAKFSMFCRKTGGKLQGKIHGKGLKLSPTDKHSFHFHGSAPHLGVITKNRVIITNHREYWPLFFFNFHSLKVRKKYTNPARGPSYAAHGPYTSCTFHAMK